MPASQAALMVASGVAYFGDRSGTLHAVDVETGKGVWKLELGSPIDSSPWPSDGRVVVGTDSGHVVAIEQAP